MAEIPRPPGAVPAPPMGRYCPLGCEGSRQRFALRYNGSFFVDKRANKADGPGHREPALERGRRWTTSSPRGDFPNFREYENACKQSWSADGAPVITSEWVDRDIEYTQTAFAAYLREDMGEYFGKRGRRGHRAPGAVRDQKHRARRAAGASVAADAARSSAWNTPTRCLTAHGRLVKTEQCCSPTNSPPAWTGRTCRAAFNWVDASPTRSRSRAAGSTSARAAGSPTPLALDRERPGGRADRVPLPGGPGGRRAGRGHIRGPVLHSRRKTRTSSCSGRSTTTPSCARCASSGRRFVDSGMKISIPDKMIEEFYRLRAGSRGDHGDQGPRLRRVHRAGGDVQLRRVRQRGRASRSSSSTSAGMHKQAEKYLDGLLLMQGAFSLDGNFQTKEGALAGIDVLRRQAARRAIRLQHRPRVHPVGALRALLPHPRQGVAAARGWQYHRRLRLRHSGAAGDEDRARRRARARIRPDAGGSPGGQRRVALLVRRERPRVSGHQVGRGGSGRDRSPRRGAPRERGRGLQGGHTGGAGAGAGSSRRS